MISVLIDTDVLLDFFFDRKPFSDYAAEILSLCEANEIRGCITAVILSNTYYLLRKNAKHEQVIDKLKQLVSFIDVITTDKNSILLALNSDFKDFEDAIQHYSAETNGKINLIITRNTKDYKSSSIGVMRPDNFLKFFFQF